MTWGEFKAEIERRGVKDDDRIEYVDVGKDWSPDEMAVYRDEEEPAYFRVS